jgi:hypothetical protein
MSKSKYVEATGEVYYARVFPQNMDDGEYHLATEGSYNCIFIPNDKDELGKLMAAGFPEVSNNYKMVKEFDFAGGRKGMKLKRPNKHSSGIEDFGGAPKVLNWTEGRGSKPWDYDIDGALGNGTKVAVKVSIYSGGKSPSVRLEGVAVVDHVPHEQAEKDMVW